MAYENNEKKNDSVYSARIRAGKRRTYFFDVRETRGSDFYLTITESRKKFNEDGYDRHKIFLYKEDFNKFIKGLTEAIDYVKTDLMPDFDFDAFNHDTPYEGEGGGEGRIDGELSTNNNHTNQTRENTQSASIEPTQETVSENKPEPAADTNYNDTAHEEVDKW